MEKFSRQGKRKLLRVRGYSLIIQNIVRKFFLVRPNIDMSNRENIIIIVVLVVLLFITGYLYLVVNGNISLPTADHYVPNLSATAYSSYSAPSFYNSRSYSIPISSTTSYSYYSTPTNYYPNRQGCYISGYDQYDNPITICQYIVQ